MPPKPKSSSGKSKNESPDIHYTSYSYSSLSSVDKNGNQKKQEKIFQIENHDGKINGKYEERENGKVVASKSIKKATDLKFLK